jgi:ribonuclease HI
VDGFLGAKYKKFKTREEAEEFVAATKPEVTKPTVTKPATIAKIACLSKGAAIIKSDHCVYTDGSCSNNGSQHAAAGIGVYFGERDPRNISQKVVGRQTNNTAELSAIIEALKALMPALEAGENATIVSDSEYAIRCATSYGERCAAENWKKDIPNKELVQELQTLCGKWKGAIHFLHIMSHREGDDEHTVGNAGADRLANEAIGLDSCPYASNSPAVKIYLNVPFAKKDEAKGLGARWDPTAKKWYVLTSSEKKQDLCDMFGISK